MSLENTYSNNIKRKKEELIRLKNELPRQTKELGSTIQKISRLNKQLKNTSSISTVRSKNNEKIEKKLK